MSKVALIVLDGLGLEKNDNQAGNACLRADAPFLRQLWHDYPHAELRADGEAVGLMPGQMGDSNVGHLNIGAGRVVWQMLPRVLQAAEDNSLRNNADVENIFRHAEEQKRPVHLLGLLSDGGVHSHIKTFYSLLDAAAKRNLPVALHLFLDGRDVPPQSAGEYLRELVQYCEDYPAVKIVSMSGRYYAMDRDKRWERNKEALGAMCGESKKYEDVFIALAESYDRGITDEFVLPVTLEGTESYALQPGDAAIFLNFRADRARQLSRLLLDMGINLLGMAEYDRLLPMAAIFPPIPVNNTLAEYLSNLGKTQLHIAETEKYAHVTFFFNGGREEPFPGEDRILIPSPKVPTYDLQPEMSAAGITEATMTYVEKEEPDFIILNYANCDMVGHTGVLDAAIKAVETVDRELGRLLPFLMEKGYAALVTSDHGNAERMLDGTEPYTAHTLNTVPLVILDKRVSVVKDGKLSDLAPTILKLMNLPQPQEMTGRSLIGEE